MARGTLARRWSLAVWMALGGVGGMPAAAEAQPAGGDKLPAFSLADIPKEDLSGWGEAQTEGQRRFRAAAKGGTRMFKVKAWWAENSLRPPEDAVYVLEAEYKDTVSVPAAFYAHGALERYHAPSVMHRFGGAGDGEWRTAYIPVGWDCLARLLEERDKTAFGVSADADLPVGQIRVRPATKADQERYNAETRAWVARVQAAKRRPPASAPAERKFLAGKELSAMVAFAWPAMVPLPPAAQPKDQQVGSAVKVRMCLNEIEGGAFGVYANGRDLTGVDYALSELTGPAGTLQADVVRRTAEYCLVQSGRGLEVFPQRLWPAYPVDIPNGQSCWFVFNLRTHRGKTQPGLYKGTITITGQDASRRATAPPTPLEARLPLEVEVLPVDLLTMEEAGLFMGGCVTGLVPAHDVAFQSDYNQNGTNLWFSGISPSMSLKEGKLVLDFTYLDEWMAAAKKRGLKGFVYFLGGDPYGWPHTATIFRELGLLAKGERSNQARDAWIARQAAPENRNAILPETRPLFLDWVRKVAAHAKAAAWPEVILTPFDEPAKWVQNGRKDPNAPPGVIGAGEWIKPFFKDACAAIRQAAPDVRIYGSIHHNRRADQEGICFLDDINVFCTNAIHEDPKLGEKVRAEDAKRDPSRSGPGARKDFWQYSGTSAAGDPSQGRYTFGFFFAAYDSRGSLCWAYNWGSGFDTTGGSNWMYAWQTPFDTIPGPYFEGLREAWDDRRVIETYRKTFATDAQALAVLEGILKAAAASRAPGGRDTVSDFWAAIDDAAKLDAWRDQLLDRLVKAAQAK